MSEERRDKWYKPNFFARVIAGRKWVKWLVVGFAVLTVVEGAAHVASEIVGKERKEAFLEGYRLDEKGGRVLEDQFWGGRNVGSLSLNEWHVYKKEYQQINRSAKYAYVTLYNMGPNFSGKFFQTDDRGFRIVPSPPDPQVPRVAFFGASVVWGHSTEFNKWTIPAYFQSLSGGRFQTDNYGMPGYNSTLATLVLRSALIRDFPNKPFDAVVMYGLWGDCSAVISKLPRREDAWPPHASDGFNIYGIRPVLFKQELERIGMIVFDFPQLWITIEAILSKFDFKGFVSYFVERERVWRLIRLLKDPNYAPWFCCPTKETLKRPFPGNPTKEELRNLLDDQLRLYSDNMMVVRAMGKKYGFKTYFVLGPMAFTKKNPMPGEYTPDRVQEELLSPCYQMARERFGSASDFIDLSTVPMPDHRVFTDVGHMVGAGNRAVGQALLEAIGPRISMGQ